MTYLRISVAVVVVLTSSALAGGPSKEECIEAHSKGQDARDSGKLSLARKLFLTCAQAGCPELVQGDCARFTDTLDREQPTASFVARDGQGADLPDTAVYVDGSLVATQLGDGKPHDLDPGSHVVKFVTQGKEQSVVVVIAASEKGRMVVASFPMINPPAEGATTGPGGKLTGRATRSETTHPLGSKIAIGVGGAATITGVALAVVGLGRIPSNCSFSSNTCNARIGDPVFQKAGDAVTTFNSGVMVGSIGLAVLAGGIVWYIKGSHTERPSVAIAPWVAPGQGGFAWSGQW